MAESNESNHQAIEQEIDVLVSTIPEVCLDSRSYYWPNYAPFGVHHERYKFMYSIPLSPTVISHSGAYYIATFSESLLLTWVGLEAKVCRRIGASTYMSVNTVEGNNPFSHDHQTVFEYCNVPPPVRIQEPRNVHLMATEDKVNIGKRVHQRVHKDLSLIHI